MKKLVIAVISLCILGTGLSGTSFADVELGSCKNKELTIPLMAKKKLEVLFSYPNNPQQSPQWSLEETILHWFGSTLERDGFTDQGVSQRVVKGLQGYSLCLAGPKDVLTGAAPYAKRLPGLLEVGWKTYTEVVPQLKKDGRWQEGWRFFLPLGLPMLEQDSLQFFHYPPERLLKVYQDYLVDPVPYRWEQLLAFNGVTDKHEAQLHETVIDGAPIAAPDNAGAYIPIDAFADYQEEMVALLLNRSQTKEYTTPIMVYGVPAMMMFEKQFHVNLDVNVPQVAKDLIPGTQTAVLGVNHPYHFYAAAQINASKGVWVGSGELNINCRTAELLMVQDLIAACWQVEMAKDVTADPGNQLAICANRWTAPEKEEDICALIQHEGSLKYTDGDNNTFKFLTSIDQGREFCQQHDNDACYGAPVP